VIVSDVRAALPLVRFGSPTRQSPADQHHLRRR
jgi:hypothetical protein